jgi:hypothetical protein
MTEAGCSNVSRLWPSTNTRPALYSLAKTSFVYVFNYVPRSSILCHYGQKSVRSFASQVGFRSAHVKWCEISTSQSSRTERSPQPIKKFPAILCDPQLTSALSQQTAIGPCLEPDKSNPKRSHNI